MDNVTEKRVKIDIGVGNPVFGVNLQKVTVIFCLQFVKLNIST